MEIIIETERLLMHELTADDAQFAYDLNSDWDVIKFTGDAHFESILAAEKFLANYPDYKSNGFGRWLVIEKKTSEKLGWCGLKLLPQINEVDLGYRFFKKNWGRGYATESGIACINYGFSKLNLQRIVGNALKENSASIKVLQKCGMKYEKDEDCGGKVGVKYAIIKS